ncbi:hypothetical protein GCM10023191_013240 [Actinoallomurus oryzae]|uniref:Transmembrane protein n=1 Tax=Actinoallomurus oryzae TaxID=502180 RepID=A0ABP8PH35_9ACTN
MSGLAAALAFTWFGMVIAISFLETPLKFRAPGITVPLGLGIGRLVFKALNIAESALAVLLLAALATGHVNVRGWVPAVIAAACLIVQMTVLRPALDRRAAVVITGGEVAPSRLHLGYVAVEVIKVFALVAAGALSPA